MKDPSFAPFYTCYLKALVEVSREHGYAMAVHGSMQRDMDLVCIPWVPEPSTPQVLIEALNYRVNRGDKLYPLGEMSNELHGRLCWNIPLGGRHYLDISIMPPNERK